MSTVAKTYIRTDYFLERLIRKKLFWGIFCSFFFFYPLVKSIYRELPGKLPIYYEVPKFKLTNQFGNPFSSDDLKGRVYLANFMFTTCPSVCKNLMDKTKKIQKRIRGLGNKVAIITFSVDPDFDTPSVLYKYSRKLKSNPYIWTFLTGEHEEMRSLVVGGFKTAMGDKEENKGIVQVNENGDSEEVTMIDIAHSEKMFLIDGKGRVRGLYSLDDISIDQMMIDLGLLVNRGA